MSKPTPAEAKILARSYLESILSTLPPLPTHLEQFYTTIPISPTYSSPAKVIRPLISHPGPRPLIIYFYGGGFLIGDPDQVTSPAREWAEKFNATVILPSYRLTPEYTWPTPMTDAFTAIQKLASGWSDREPFFGANPNDGFVVGGLSAGATVVGVAVGLATNGGQYALERPLTGVFLCAPWFFTDELLPEEFRGEYKSMYEEDERQTIKPGQFRDVLESLKIGDRTSELISPVRGLKKWPKSYFQAMQFDPLRDDALILEKMLRRVGTDVKVRVFMEDGHAGMSSMPAMHRSKEPMIEEDTMDGMGWLLGRT